MRGTIGWILLALLTGCQSRSSPEEVYGRAYQNFLQGNLRIADQQVELGARQWSARSSPDWHVKFLLLRARVMLQRGQYTEVLALLHGLTPGPSLEVNRKVILGNVLAKVGRYDEAESVLAVAENEAVNLGLRSLLPEIEVRKGYSYSKHSQGSLAVSTLQHAIDLGRRQNEPFSEMEALNQLGTMLMKNLQPDGAIPYFTQALALSEAIGARHFREIFQDNLSICYGLIGEFEKSLAIRDQAIAYFKKADAKTALQQAIGEKGSLFLDKGETEHALPCFKEAYDMSIAIQKPSDTSIWAAQLALAYVELGRWNEAEIYNNKAAELQASLHETDTLQYTHLNAALISAGKGETERAEASYRDLIQTSGLNYDVLVQAQAGYGALEVSRSNWAEARKQFDDAILGIERARVELLKGDHRITYIARLIGFYRQYVEALVRQGDAERALYIADSSRALSLSEGGTERRARGITPTPDYRQIARRWNGVLLSYWITPRESYLWAISPRDIRLVKLPASREIEPWVGAYRSAIEQPNGDPLQSRSAIGHKLYKLLLQPVADMMPAGSRVFLVADGPLHNLNFEALLTPDPSSHYWVQDVTLSIAPSLKILSSGPPATTVSAQKLLLIGDPEGHEPDAPKLQYSGRELSRIQSQFPTGDTRLFAELQATPEIYRATAGDGYSTIHFSAHAIANRQSPLDSAIVLSPSSGGYKLYAREIMDIPINADLVTLSACRSAGANAYAGEGLVGFSWAFLHAGARNVVAGLWDVSDRSTADFMGNFYAQLRSGKEPAEALRAAKLDFVQSTTGYKKPYYWAAFQIYTTGRVDNVRSPASKFAVVARRTVGQGSANRRSPF